LYLDAVEAAEPGSTAAGAVFASIRDRKRNQGVVRERFNVSAKKDWEKEGPKYTNLVKRSGSSLYSDEEFQTKREEARTVMHELVAKMQAGEFGPKPIDHKACENCSVAPACRIRELDFP